MDEMSGDLFGTFSEPGSLSAGDAYKKQQGNCVLNCKQLLASLAVFIGTCTIVLQRSMLQLLVL